jgi:uncharacterized protein (DUF885 family)
MRHLAALCGLAFLWACGPGQELRTVVADAESARLQAYLDQEYEEELRFSPEALTMQGRREMYDRLDDRSEAAMEAYLAWRRESVGEMKATFDYDRLNDEARTSFDLWADALDEAELANRFRRHEYIFIRGGPHTEIPNFLINFHEVSDVSDLDAYLSRLALADDVIAQLIERAGAAADAGIRPPRFAYEQAIEEARRVIAGAPVSGPSPSALLADAEAKIGALAASGALTSEQADTYRDRVSDILAGEFADGYRALVDFLSADMANAPSGPPGVLSLPSGAEYYAAQLRSQTTTDLTADAIHQIGLNEVDRIHAEMDAIREAVGFDGDLRAFFSFMRDADRFHLPETDEGRAAYIAQAEGYLSAMQAKLPEYFGVLPKAPLVVRRVEPFREEPGGAQHYYPGSPDGARPGVFYAHLSDMKAMPTYELESIAYHEGVPGHHMQISIAQELTGLPKFRTQYGHTAFVEGWALYTEALAKDMGFYADPYSDYGRLSAELWRAIRLVVDTGLHAKGWSEEAAVAYFLENSSVPEAAIISEIRRYIVWPGQATAYKIGMMRIQDLRREAMETLGPRFDWRGFHDVVLSGGSVPLTILERRVRAWIRDVAA